MSVWAWLAFAWFVIPVAFVTGAVCALLALEIRRRWRLVVLTSFAMAVPVMTMEALRHAWLWASALSCGAGAVVGVIGKARRRH